MDVNKIIGIALGLYVTANLLPDAITAILEANVTAWGTSLSNLFQTVVPIMALIGIVVLFIRQT